MRGLNRMLRRRGPTLELTAADRRRAPEAGAASMAELAAEIESVAGYVDRMRRAAAALQPRAMGGESIPALVGDLRRIRQDMDAAVDSIVTAAEAILDFQGPDRAYREMVRDRLTAILEACSFHDLAGQRIGRAETILDGMAERLAGFVAATGIADGDGPFSRRAVTLDVRREVLLVEGPQRSGEASQGAIDELFG